MRTVELEAEIKTIEDDSVRLLETIRGLQVHNDWLPSSDQGIIYIAFQYVYMNRRFYRSPHRRTRKQQYSAYKLISKSGRTLRDTRNQNRKYHQSIIFQHLAISKLRDGLASAYRAARDNIDPQSARICSVVSRHLVELKKLEIWLLNEHRAPTTR
ncbi:hypothetical protein CPB85DRAFT_840410 [Mucidula mucida]|nr:hypothetical protein CPB85DRAFT_840410 [Mucidula mucida]